jgi:hypothetical protein
MQDDEETVRPDTAPGWRRPVIGGGFYLERSPRAQALLALFVLGAAYFLFEQLSSVHRYAGGALAPLAGVAALGAAVALAAFAWLRAGAVPSRESLGLACALGATLSVAAYWGALRVNALTDADGPSLHTYVKQQGPRWIPVEDGLPPLEFTTDLDYWADFAPGRTLEFSLHRGALGFWQLDLRPIREDQRVWREFMSSLEPAASPGT